MKRDWWLAAMAALLMSPGMAQTAKPKEDAAAAEAAAAMERARRQAANPMRIILEASKGKRRNGVDDTPAAAPDSSVRPVVNRSAAAPTAAATPAPEPAPRAAAVTPAAAVAVTPPQPVAAAPAPVPEPVVTQITLTSDVAQAKAAAPVPALAPTGAAAVAATAVAPPPVALPALEVAPARPRLLSMVEPEVPQRLLDELGRNATVAVDMLIRPDGTAGDITIAGAAPRGLQRVLAAAIEQWRFAPLPAARAHRVELVFNADR